MGTHDEKSSCVHIPNKEKRLESEVNAAQIEQIYIQETSRMMVSAHIQYRIRYHIFDFSFTEVFAICSIKTGRLN